MIVTEAEAKLKQCCVFAGHGHKACCASECMGWVWGPRFDIQRFPGDPPIDPPVERRGRCGRVQGESL